MRRWFLSLFVCLALLLGVRMAKATNIGLENVPGGAAITYWTCADGYQTLVNVQNVDNQNRAIAVHIVFFDQDSNEIMDFNVPLSPYDNWGAAVTCENGQLVVTPGTQPFYQGPNNGGKVRRAPSDATEGYVTVTITAIDGGSPFVVPCTTIANGDPRDEIAGCNFRNVAMPLPNSIILRSAMVNYAEGNAFALNSFSLVNFKNDGGNIANCNGATGTMGNSVLNPRDDMNGVRISMCELLAERRGAVQDYDAAAGLQPNFVVGAPGYPRNAAAPNYWARYGNNGIVRTSLVLIFPAQGGGNQLDLTVFDDNEMTQSAYYEAPEVAHIILDTDIAAFDSGEILISVRNRDLDRDNPSNPNDDPFPAFFGFSLVEGPNFVDIYPIVRAGFAYCDDAINRCSRF